MRGKNARNKDDIYASCTRWSGFSKTDGATMLSSPNAACRCARTPLPTLVCVGKRQLRPEAHFVKTCLSTCVATRLRFWPTVSRCNPLIVPGRNRAASVHPIGMTHLAGVFISLEWASQRDNQPTNDATNRKLNCACLPLERTKLTTYFVGCLDPRDDP